jgi:hypothetical protein
MTEPPFPLTDFLEKQPDLHRPQGSSPDILDYTLFLPGICLACALGVSLRLIGPLFVVIPVGFCFLYAVLRRTVPPRLLSTYFAFCIFIAVLSKYRLLPTSWQVYFMPEAIVRQLVPLVGFYAVAWASKAYFRRRLVDGDVFFGTPLLLLLGLVVAPAIMFQQGRQYQGDDPAHTVLASYGAFINNNVVAGFFVMAALFLARDWRRYVGLVFVLGVAATTHFVQFKILTAVAVAALFGAPERILVIGLMATLTGIYAVGINFVPDAMSANPNSGIRLAFLADALSSVIDTHGIGIGYGTESVRWRYQFTNLPDFTFFSDPRSMTHDRMLEVLSTGIHNSLVQALLRTGVVGFALLTVAFFAAFPPRNLARGVRNHAAVLFAMIFIACFVNPALESPVQVVGIGFIYGYLVALRAKARHPIIGG